MPPQRAIGLTFTNAAASEMLVRLKGGVNPKYLDYVDAMTFHSFSYRVLRAYGNYLGLSSDFRILRDEEKKAWFKVFLQGLGVQGQAIDGLWFQYMDWEKSRILRLQVDPPQNSSPFAAVFSQFWQAHKARQIEENALDFNHLLWLTHQLFQSYPGVLEIYRRVYGYFLVDEFQDTNPIQFSILKRLVRGDTCSVTVSQPLPPVFIFADDLQSIYGFLGAAPKEQAEEAVRLFGCERIELTKDHRTTTPALSLFGRVLRDSRTSTIDGSGQEIPLQVFSDSDSMSLGVNTMLTQWVEAGIPLHEIAILARQKTHLMGIQNRLTHDYLSVPDLQTGIEDNPIFKVLEKLSLMNTGGPSSLRDTLNRRTRSQVLGEGEAFIREILLTLAGNYDLRYSHLRLCEKAKLMANEALLEINWGHQLRQLCRNRVFVGTLHSAKGLEFRAVAIAHLEQDSFPSWFFICKHCKNGRVPETKASIEEEWRVFYVGVTRARERLALFSSATRITQNGAFTSPVTCLVRPPIWNYLRIEDYRGLSAQSKQIRCTLCDHAD